ncbi:MAG: ABC transporter ATP-binding protein, partial [Sneathiella sp.]
MPLLAWSYETGGFTSDYSFLVALGLGSLGIIIASNFLLVVRSWAVARFSLMRMHTLSHRLLATYLKQPYEFFLDHHSGEMSTQILAESQEVVSQFIRPAGEVIGSVVTIIAIVTVLLCVNPTVAIVAFAVIGGLYGGTFLVSRRLVRRHGRARLEGNSARYRLANEALGGVKDIKLSCREQAYVERFMAPSLKVARAAIAAQVIGQVPQYVMQAVGFGGMIALCLVMLDPVELTSGAAVGSILPLIGVFAFGGQRLLPDMSRLYAGLTQLNAGAAAVDAIHADLTSLAGARALTKTLPPPLGLKSELSLEQVSYSYPAADHAGIRDVSLTIQAGEKIGIVGTTGAGKTTLADVILGLLPPRGGRLVADGTEITQDNLRAWLQTVGYVPQDIFLIDASVAENIALGLADEEIDRERLLRAAQIAQI